MAGIVRDSFNAMTLPGAPITVVATNEVVYSELDGAFSLSLPAGSHEIRVSFSGYEEVVVPVEVQAGATTRVDVALTMERFAEEVVVTGEAIEPELFTAEAQLVERQKAATITDNLASEEMKENADSNAASAMKRVTGLTVVDNQYVFVRGLGERYSNTTLNGAVLPTTEPDKRVVPLDLFPTGLIESVSVVKSYLPDKPADFSGGLVEIDPLSFPTEPVMNFSMSQGYNTRTTFEDGLIYPGGGRDWLGFDDGTRSLPPAIPDSKVVRTSRFTSAGFTPAELETIGESFSNVWTPRNRADRPEPVLQLRGRQQLGPARGDLQRDLVPGPSEPERGPDVLRGVPGRSGGPERLRLRCNDLEDLDRSGGEPRLQVHGESPGRPRELLHPQFEERSPDLRGLQQRRRRRDPEHAAFLGGGKHLLLAAFG